MTDREKVIKGLECCRDVQSGWKDARYVCPVCPYTDNGIPCETLAPLVDDALALLKEQEPVVHGFWDDSFDGITPYCSACGMSHRCINRTPDYCPNCGARMDGERRDEDAAD